MRRLSRRHFLATSSAALATLPVVRLGAQEATGPFRHGVASGDPMSESVVLWTRVTTAQSGRVDVSWTIARDAALSRVVARGTTPTGAQRDHTVKVIATGLEPGTTYYYRFEALKGRSPVGRTRTLPATGVARVRLGVASCSNLPLRVLQRVPPAGGAPGSRRGAPPRRLHLRVRERPLRRRDEVRSRFLAE